jgi:hypothetical protein
MKISEQHVARFERIQIRAPLLQFSMGGNWETRGPGFRSAQSGLRVVTR